MRYAGFLAVLLAAITVGLAFQQQSLVASNMQVVAAWLFQRFEDDTFPLLLAAGILAVAVVLLIAYLILIVIPQALSLRRIRTFLRRFPDEAAFAADFDEVSERLAASRLIGHAWAEFRETLVEPDGGRVVVQNTTRPQTFINFSCSQDKSTSLRIMPHIPNYFVGVGLLLTFVGLVAALNFASGSMGGNANDAVKGLQKVLAAATFKFWTSIAGLLASIILSFTFRLYALYLEGEFNSLCRALERRMAFATPQRIFVDVRDAIEEQLVETKKINTDVAMSIAEGVGKQFREHVPAMLADAMQPLVDAVQESSEKVRDGATGGLENMVNQFATTLEGSTGQHLNHMSDTLQQLTRSLEAMHGSMNSSGDDFARRMAEGAERLDATMREIADSMRTLIEGLKSQIEGAGEAFGSTLQESLERLARQSEEMSEQLAQHSRDASAAFSDEIARAAQALSSTANDNAEASARFSQQLRENLGESAEGVQGALDRVSESLGTLQGQLERQGTAMSSISERSQETARSMADASRAINEGIEPFQRVGQSLTESSARLEQSVTSIAAKIESAVATVETVSEELSGVSTTLQSAWENYRVRFENVDEDLEKTFTLLQEAVENQQRNVQEFVRGLDESFDRALSGLSGGIDGINTTIEDLTEALETMNRPGMNQ
jgi:methyl-accepting chemotaxis protein